MSNLNAEQVTVVAAYREIFETENSAPCTLEDNVVWDIIVGVPNSESNKADTAKRIEAMLEAQSKPDDDDRSDDTPEDAAKAIEAGNSIASRAVAAAAIANADPEFNKALRTEVDHREAVKVGPLVMLRRLETLFGDTLLDMPVPDTDKTESNNPDKFDIHTTKENGQSTTKKNGGSFWYSFVDSLEEGKLIQSMIDATKRASPKIKDFTGLAKQFEHTNPVQIAKIGKKWTQRLAAVRSIVKTAMKMAIKAKALSDYPAVQVTFEDEIATPTPIAIQSATKVTDWTVLTIVQFNALNLQEARKNGGTYQSLMDTVGKRDSGDGNSNQGGGTSANTDKVPPIKNIGGLENYLSEVGAFFDKLKGKEETAKLNATLSKNEELLLLWGDICMFMDGAFTPHHVHYRTLDLARTEKEARDKIKVA